MDIDYDWLLTVEVELNMAEGVTGYQQNGQFGRVMEGQCGYLMIWDSFKKLLAILEDVVLTKKLGTSRMWAPAR